jgi:hypothetical protein
VTQPDPFSSPYPAARRARRNRLLLMGVFWFLLALESAGSGRPLSHSPLASGLGSFLGMLAAIQLQHLVALALGRVGGTAPTLLFLGSGRWLTARRIGPVTLVLRTVPVFPLQVGQAIVAGPLLRLRLLIGGLCRVGAVVALGVLLILTGSLGPVFAGAGALLYALMLLIGAPRRPGTVSWMIFRAPFADAALLGGLSRTRAELAGERALMGARFAEARAAVAAVSADRVAGARVKAAVEIAEGRYDDAKRTLDTAREGGLTDRIPGGELLLARAMLFSLEDGSATREDALPAAQAAIVAAQQRIPRLFASTEVLATLALLNGRAADALLMAKESLRRTTDLQTRAHSLCTLAGAQAVTGDQPAARASLASARALAPQLARIATVERLVAELPLVRDRV